MTSEGVVGEGNEGEVGEDGIEDVGEVRGEVWW